MRLRSIPRQRWESFGCLMIVSAAFGAETLTNHRIGTVTAMGPGFFPIVLSAVTTVLAIAILVQPDASESGDMRVGIRPFVSIISGITAFAVLVGLAGLFPAMAAAVTIAATGSKGFSWSKIICLGLVAAAFCSIVFVYGLALPFPLFRRPF